MCTLWQQVKCTCILILQCLLITGADGNFLEGYPLRENIPLIVELCLADIAIVTASVSTSFEYLNFLFLRS
jgi:hypothetical protein